MKTFLKTLERNSKIMDRFIKNEELTEKERSIINAGEWRINKAKCLLCGDEVESRFRHDFKECKCGAMFVDGGSCYPRRGGDFVNIKDMSERYKSAKNNPET